MAAAASGGLAWINPTEVIPSGKDSAGVGEFITKYAAFASGYMELMAKFLSNAMAEVYSRPILKTSRGV